MSDLATELSRFTNAAADLATAKANQKDALTALGQTVDDDWSTYPEKLSAVSGATVQDSKTVEPNPAGMEIRPDDGYGAMLKVILAAEPNFQPWNIAAGIQIWGKTGTARPYVKPGGTDWPDVPATEEEMDEAVTEDDADAPVEDKFVLMDNEGNVTTGYMYTEENSGLCVYNGTVLPELPELEENLPYILLSKHGESDDDVFYNIYFLGAPVVYNGSSYTSPGESISFRNALNIKPGATSWGTIYSIKTADRMTASSFNAVWANFDVLDPQGTVLLAASDPTPYGGFEITRYDPTTTEFRAIGWRRVSKHTTGDDAGKITRDDFTRTESGGWNYLKNIRSCTREKLYYKGVEVWPDPYGNISWTLGGEGEYSITEKTDNGLGYVCSIAEDLGLLYTNVGDLVRLTVNDDVLVFTVFTLGTGTRCVGNAALFDTSASDNGGDYFVMCLAGDAYIYTRTSGVYSIKIEIGTM